MALSLQAHNLQGSRSVDTDRRSCRDTSDLFDVAAKERIARARIWSETNTTFDSRAIKESEFTIPDPFILLEDSRILACEHIKQVW